MSLKLASIAGLAAAAAIALSAPANAVEGRYGVKACSKTHAGKCVQAPVKSYSMGQKVRLPGGTWVDCAGDCRDKLRKETVDYWYQRMLDN